jgi:hypothetical protein
MRKSWEGSSSSEQQAIMSGPYVSSQPSNTQSALRVRRGLCVRKGFLERAGAHPTSYIAQVTHLGEERTRGRGGGQKGKGHSSQQVAIAAGPMCP